MATWKNTAWSNEEVQTFLCLVAEERIQRELDRATRNERRRYDNRVCDGTVWNGKRSEKRAESVLVMEKHH